MARKLGDWITSYLKYVENTEPPIAFHIWSAISLIGATMERRCYMNMGFGSWVFPNEYVVLVSPAGAARKSETLKLIEPFTTHAKLNTLPTTITREALFMRLEHMTIQNPLPLPEGGYGATTPAYAISTELINLFGRREANEQFLAVLCELWDAKARVEYVTKTSGQNVIENTCLSILGAAAQDWFPIIFGEMVSKGGILSRMIIVAEDKKGRSIAHPEDLVPDKQLHEALQDDLLEILHLHGQFKWANQVVGNLYRVWYEEGDAQSEKGNNAISDLKFATYDSRRAIHLRKVCMCLSASRGNDLLITEADFMRARAILERMEKRLSQAFLAFGANRYIQTIDNIIMFMRREKSAPRSRVISVFCRDLNDQDYDRVEKTLLKMGVVRIGGTCAGKTHILNDVMLVYEAGHDPLFVQKI